MSALIVHAEEHVRRLARDAQHHYTNAHTKLNNLLQNTTIQPKPTLYSLLFLATFIWLAITTTRLLRTRRPTTSRPNTPNLEKRTLGKAPERPFGGTSTYPSFASIPSPLSLPPNPHLHPY
jgi:hypothetical protein